MSADGTIAGARAWHQLALFDERPLADRALALIADGVGCIIAIRRALSCGHNELCHALDALEAAGSVTWRLRGIGLEYASA